ncbi:MAG: hypothetical protein H6818_19185 [Phycisphaerales bacterium]|nr:hypothetical protein [Phycisphaerales bacterium]
MLDKDRSNITEDVGGGDGPLVGDVALGRKLGLLEAQFSLLSDQVRELQRLASLGTMSAVVAHEINNLLTPMISYGQFAAGQSNPDVWRKAVDRANDSAVRLRALCNGILGIASNVRTHPSVSAIKPLLEETLYALGRDWKKDKIDAACEAEDSLVACFDTGAMRQVLFNLSINARQAMMGRGGRLRLRAEAHHGGRVRLSVSDTGMGIPPENLPRIFEPFFTTKRRETRSDSGGVGLGLYVCRCLVEEQGGSIAVESRVGEGTTFLIELPGAASNA